MARCDDKESVSCDTARCDDRVNEQMCKDKCRTAMALDVALSQSGVSVVVRLPYPLID